MKHALEKVICHRLCPPRKLLDLIREHWKSPMLSLTHGQPATPLLLKRDTCFYNRIERQIIKLQLYCLGKYMAQQEHGPHNIAFASVDWFKFTSKFVLSGLRPNWYNQLNPIASRKLKRSTLKSHIKGSMSRHVAIYKQRNYFTKKLGGEVGSSTMPQSEPHTV